MNVHLFNNFDCKNEDFPIPHSMTMKVALGGRVKNIELPKRKPLLPLFEAISNSIHAIEDSGIKNGRIVIRILRDQQWLFDKNNENKKKEPRVEPPIQDFIIEDNGIGFTDQNFESFETCDSLHKATRGAKGVGRLLWLKAFESVSINSSYSVDSTSYKRSFNFNLPDGVTNHEFKQLENVTTNNTQVILQGFKKEFFDCCPKLANTIADKLLLHLATNFLNPNLPSIDLIDDSEDEKINLNCRFRDFFSENGLMESFTIFDYTFEIHHLCLKIIDHPYNSFQLAANFREVDEVSLKNNLSEKLSDLNGRSFAYLGLITSSLFDKRVNANRTGFELPQEGELFERNVPSLDRIISTAREKATKYLDPFLKTVQDKIFKRLEHFVQRERPEVRPMLPILKKRVGEFSSKMSSDDIEKQVALIQLDEEHKTRVESKSLFSNFSQPIDSDEYRHNFQSYVQRINEQSKTRLAQYVAHRKIILDLLAQRLKFRQDEKYELEEKIHELIFPLRATSDDHDVWQHQNLWLIDERLAYHRYLSSDKQLRSIPVINSASQARPDLLIFNCAGAFSITEESKPHEAITIIEFKRPGRYNVNLYEKSPLDQIYDYIQAIRDNKELDYDGRPITVTPSTLFYVYLICDFRPDSDFGKSAGRYGLIKSADGCSYIGFNSENKAYIEMISFDKLINDARQRNRIFFQQMNIHETSKPIETIADIIPPK